MRLTAGSTSYIFAHKEVPPYYGQKNDSSPLQLGPTSYIFACKEVPPYYAKKIMTIPDNWDPQAISSHARECLITSHQLGAWRTFFASPSFSALVCSPRRRRLMLPS